MNTVIVSFSTNCKAYNQNASVKKKQARGLEKKDNYKRGMEEQILRTTVLENAFSELLEKFYNSDSKTTTTMCWPFLKYT